MTEPEKPIDEPYFDIDLNDDGSLRVSAVRKYKGQTTETADARIINDPFLVELIMFLARKIEDKYD